MKKREGQSDRASTAVNQRRFDLYFDESGQHIGGEPFIVAGVAVEDSDKFNQLCESLERTSGKHKAKWRKANKNGRLVYLRTVISDVRFRDIILFSYVFRETKNYVDATVRSIDLAIASLPTSDTSIHVYVDGLPKTQYREYKARLRRLECRVEKVRGRKDENEPLIRLADAVAGATRHLLKPESKNSELKEIFSLAVKQGILVGWTNSSSGPHPAVYM